MEVSLTSKRVVVYLLVIRGRLEWILGRLEKEIFENSAQEYKNGELPDDESLSERRLEEGEGHCGGGQDTRRVDFSREALN